MSSKTSRSYMDFRLFRKRVEAGNPPDQALLRVHSAGPVQQGEGRNFIFVFSDDSRDRYGNTVNQLGWKLDNFKKGGGPFLWAHQYDHPPVGKVNHLMTEDHRLLGDVEFTPKGMSEFNDMIYDMVQGGFLNATSVGFVPIPNTYTFNDETGGYDFQEQELLEVSVVPIPANPNALIEARSAGIDLNELERWVTNSLFWIEQEGSVVVPRENLLIASEALGMSLDSWHSPTEVIKEMLEVNLAAPEAEEVEAPEAVEEAATEEAAPEEEQVSPEILALFESYKELADRLTAIEKERAVAEDASDDDSIELDFDDEDESAPEAVLDISEEELREVVGQTVKNSLDPVFKKLTKLTGKVI